MTNVNETHTMYTYVFTTIYIDFKSEKTLLNFEHYISAILILLCHCILYDINYFGSFFETRVGKCSFPINPTGIFDKIWIFFSLDTKSSTFLTKSTVSTTHVYGKYISQNWRFIEKKSCYRTRIISWRTLHKNSRGPLLLHLLSNRDYYSVWSRLNSFSRCK